MNGCHHCKYFKSHMKYEGSGYEDDPCEKYYIIECDKNHFYVAHYSLDELPGALAKGDNCQDFNIK